jgi:hypothetical protein
VLGGRIVTPGEPLWTQDDTDLAAALTEIDSERHACGHPRVESMDPAHEFDWQADFVRCHACASIDRAARRAAEDKSWDGAGINWITRRRGDG